MGIADMGNGESNFGGGMSEMGGGNLAEQQRERARAQQQQARGRIASIQARARATVEKTKEIKKKAEQIKNIKRTATFGRILLMSLGGCIPAFIIFVGGAFIGIMYGVMTETSGGKILGSVFSWFNDDFSEAKKELESVVPAPPAK